MSVAPLTAQELGCFAAIAHKHCDGGPIEELCHLMELASSGNAAAYSAQYNEPMDGESAADIKAAALDYLADRLDMERDHFGPIAYNMIANDGTAYLTHGVEVAQEHDVLTTIDNLETKVRKWQEIVAHKIERAEQNAAAYDDIGQLRTLTVAELQTIKQAMKADRVIVAEFCVDESDIQSDYFGGRTARYVVIGFGKGKRENFKQLRAAAEKFPPTAHMGTGKDIYTVRVIHTNDVRWNGTGYWHGTGSHWHDDEGNGTTFATQAEADAFVASKGQPHDVGCGDETCHFAWQIDHSSYEQRECSMGGGNYLGSSRYGGWKVRSYEKPYGERYEFFA